MTWKASLLLAISFLIAGCSSDNSESSAGNETADSTEETEETNDTEETATQSNSPIQTPTEYTGYTPGRGNPPFYKVDVPDIFTVDPDYYAGPGPLVFTYEPKDIDYFHEGGDYNNAYDQISTLKITSSEIGNGVSNEEYLEQLRTKTINSFVSDGTTYDVIEKEDTEMGPFEYGLRTEEDDHTQITFHTEHEGIGLQATLTIPHDTEEGDMILEQGLEALQTVTFDNPETWEERPDRARFEHEVVYEPYERSEPGTIAEDGYSITFPAFPEEFSLVGTDPASYYMASKTYEDLVDSSRTEYKRTRSSIEILSMPVSSNIYSEEAVAQLDKDDKMWGSSGNIQSLSFVEDNFEMGDFTTGVHREFDTFEEYFFITETETSVIIARYNLIPGTDDYEELKSIYEETITTFELH
ncbi:hypothetical protein ATL39_2791 [Sinobaca qinghaiensis]|uniref:DUF1795 domain-containing protein n=1 Tax=Sinobaca qinghaiensis TaxID=342944 RepID=A0A419V0A9_9BACL|nr:hypothetical protein [Sinobaca qinghaiensis]RKD71394.1 hypothetical protein ATL39_2791 [Sinobaca qinghaiensis]